MKGLTEEDTARAAIEALLEAAVEAFCKPGMPCGCMLVLSAINSTSANKSVQDYLRGARWRLGTRWSQKPVLCGVTGLLAQTFLRGSHER